MTPQSALLFFLIRFPAIAEFLHAYFYTSPTDSWPPLQNSLNYSHLQKLPTDSWPQLHNSPNYSRLQKLPTDSRLPLQNSPTHSRIQKLPTDSWPPLHNSPNYSLLQKLPMDSWPQLHNSPNYSRIQKLPTDSWQHLHNSLNYSHLQELPTSNSDRNLGNLFHSRPAWIKVVMSTLTNSRTIKTYKVNVLWVFGAKRITQICLVTVPLFVYEWWLWTDKSAINSRWMWQKRQHTLCTAHPQMWAIPKEVTQQIGGQ